MQKRDETRIHIDREKYSSPTPTTGEALYKLGDIGPHKELYREVPGDGEDQLVPRDNARLDLKQDEHFYSQKAVTIVVNGEAKETSEIRLSFDEAIALAFGSAPTGPNIVFTIAYRKGPAQNPKGTLVKGETVKIKNGMVFDVTATDRS
ncbi:hypothetical protein HJB87_26860 [Rhizobium sp. NZLR4b]|nr:hypothetical protein [Rhizobium sp. NZLR4b]MBX5211176.1 hypothetical protein [Rhizobium sp. NZLR11]